MTRQRKALLIAGMHRSGTSAVTRVLNFLGVKLSSDLLAGFKHDNPDGYWESGHFNQLHDELLHSLDSSWDNPAATLIDRLSDEYTDQFNTSFQRQIETDFDDCSLFAIKDPRLSLLAPIWIQALQAMQIEPHIVIPFRNPLEVAASLKKRNNILPAKAYLLWLRYNLSAEFYSRDHKRSFSSYDMLLQDWHPLVAKLAHDLEISWPRHTTKAEVKIDHFLTLEARHHHFSDSDLEKLPEWVKTAYQAFQLLLQEAQNTEAIQSLDDIRKQLNQADTNFNLILTDQQLQIRHHQDDNKRLEQDKVTSENMVTGLNQSLTQMQVGLSEWRTEAESQKVEVENQKVEVENQKTEVENQKTEVENQKTEVENQKTEVENQKTEVENQKTEVENQKTEVENHKSMLDNMHSEYTQQQQQAEILANTLEQKTHLFEQVCRENQQQVEILVQEANDKANENQKLNDQSVEQAGRIQQLQEQITGLQECLNETESNLAVMHDSFESQSAYLDYKLNQLFTVSNKIESLKHSGSWRLTSGLRFSLRLSQAIPRWSRWALSASLFKRLSQIRQVHLVRQSGLLDPDWYAEHSGLGCQSESNLTWHYFIEGAQLRLNPNAWFDTTYYLETYPDVLATKINPLYHYLTNGASEGRNPCIEFDTLSYLQDNPDVAEANVHPLVHYLRRGQYEQRPIPRLVVQPVEDDCVEIEDKHIDLATLDEAFDPEWAGKTRLIAFFLPQFHPIPENDQWWGKGFTEWHNVTRATPMFEGHQQPILPSELGFYDLRLADTRKQQAELAKTYGIHGFCYYYYWFNGRRLLERPLEEILASGEPDFPFCICWANEDWTRRWDGLDSDVLMAQKHSLNSDYQFIQDVIPILKDPRYIRVEGKPLLIIYRAELMDNANETSRMWRDACLQAGVGEIHLCSVIFREFNPVDKGFDAAIEFPPHFFPAPNITETVTGLNPEFSGAINDYSAAAEHLIQYPPDPGFPIYRGVMPAWDNSARRGSTATIFQGSRPDTYARWLRSAIHYRQPAQERKDNLVFINAWNEWAEGAVLEPSQQSGREYLEATHWALTNQLPTPSSTQSAETQVNLVPEPSKHTPQPSALEQRMSHLVLKSPSLTAFAFRHRNLTNTALNIIRRLPEPDKIMRSRNSVQNHPAAWKPVKGSDGNSHKRPLLLVTHDAARAGSQLVLIELVQYIAQLNEFEPYLLMLEGGVLESDFNQWACTLNLETLTQTLGSVEAAQQAVLQTIHKTGFELAICNTVVSSDWVVLLNQANIPVLTLVHELATSIEAMFGRHTIEQVVQHSRHVIAVSEFALQTLLDRFQLERDHFTVVHPCVLPGKLEELDHSGSAARFRKNFNLPDDAKIVLGCGELHPRKGTDLFIQLAHRYFQSDSADESVYFVWVGGGDPFHQTWYEHDVSASGLDKQVLLVGQLPSTADAFAAASVFALTSREDPFPLVNLEAMAQGLPVLAFAEAGGAPEAIETDAGIVCNYLDMESMLQALQKLLSDQHFRIQISKQARDKVREKYLFPAYCSNINEVVQKHYGLTLR